MFRHFRTVTAAALLTLATYAAAAELAREHPDTYVVRRGDTLWDISAKFLSNPWLWPEIWQANPQIANPHLIYPGDVISLAYLDRVNGVAVKPGPRNAAPINALPLSEIEPFLKDLRVVDSFEELPYVAGIQNGRLRGSGQQNVYAIGLESAQPGQRYAVVRPTAIYAEPRPHTDLDIKGRPIPGEGSHWKTNQVPNERSEFLGYELERVSFGNVVTVGTGEQSTTLLLEDNGHEVRAGDRLVAVEAQVYDLQFVPHAPTSLPEDGKLRILAVAGALGYGGPRDVVAISGGSREGLDNGSVLSIWRTGDHVIDPLHRGSTSRIKESRSAGAGRNAMPDEYAAHVMIFRTFEKVSYGLIMEGSAPAGLGYFLRDPDTAMSKGTATASR
ncbi:MAG: LysM peptidoglycan-binding domain-containing protein [Pseudoxanthomonas sp.]